MRLLLIASFVICMVACKKEENVPADPERQWIVVKVQGDTTAAVNAAVPITVFWPYSNGCNLVNRFSEEKSASNIDIKAFGHVGTGICTQDAGVKTVVYNFKSSVTGSFTLRFFSPDGSIIVHRVSIL